MAFLAHLLAAVLVLAAGGSANPTDADLLLELKATFENGDAELDTWKAGTDPCQGWEGIKCDARSTSVTEIDLNGFSRPYLVGSLPRSGWRLPPSLQRLSLWKNSIQGTLPADWQLPPSLVTLDLASNLLTGSIPPDLKLPPTLQQLSLDTNSLSGGLPRGLALPPWSILTVYNNLLSGTLPSWGPNVSITAKPGNDGLCGEVPSDADYIEAGSGNLEPGELPSCTAVLTQQLLDLRRSFVNGREVLAGWGNGSEPCSWSGIICTNGSVTEINLRGRGLRGYLPPSGWALPGTLATLDLSTNMIGGRMPDSWPWIASNQGLYLDLHSNYIGGTLPTWAHRTNSITVQSGNGALCGQVPTTPRYLIYTVGGLQQLPNCSAVATKLLLGFKSIFSNSNDTVLADWGESADPCQWPGIDCSDDGNVTGIVLAGKGLQGSIPGQATCMNCAGCYGCWQDLPATTEVLDLSSNPAFIGSIPAAWVLPASLRQLNLSGNALAGSIAQGWPLPPRLQELDLSSNGLAGSIHGNWPIPPTLRALLLQNNSLTGSVPPPSWVPVESLEGLVLRLDSNSLAGVLPTWPGERYNVTVRPKNEELCGEIPATPAYQDAAGAALQQLPSCAQLSADRLLALKSQSFNNSDSGSVLPSWTGGNPCGGWAGVTCSTLDEVTALRLQGQGLQGTFPPSFFQPLPPTLDTLDLSSNPLWGTISAGWKLPPTLRTLSLSSTNLVGAIPAGLSLPPTLQNLSLDANALTGLLPTNMLLPPRLEEMWLHANRLRGSILEGWNLTLPHGLRVLSLHNNTLTGTLPSWPDRAELNVSVSPGNPWLCGEVPPSPRYVKGEGPAANGPAVASLPGCTQVSADMLLAFKSSLVNSSSVLEDWSGTDPCQWSGVSCYANGSVSSLVLDGRGLGGSISPASWVFPASISVLDLSHNAFSQSIPPDFALPPRLERLELDSNLLTGSIPWDWNMSLPADQPGLEIWLQNNSLSGPLPAWSNSSTVQLVVQAGNEGLCGTVPQSPRYVTYNATDLSTAPLEALQGCPEPTASPVPEPGGSASAGVVAGIVVAAVVAALAAAVLGYWCWARRRRAHKTGNQQAESEKEFKEGAELEANHTALLNATAAGKGKNLQDKPNELLQRDDLLRSIVSKIPAGGGAAEVEIVQGAGSRRKGLEVDMKLWTVGFGDLKLVKEVGSGAFGRVYLAAWRETPVAVKLLVGPAIDLTNLNAAAEQVLSDSNPVLANLQKEASMMAALRHPNVLGFMGICKKPPSVVSEYCARGSLFDVLKAARSSQRLAQELNWPRRLMMAMDGAKGMNYLHCFKPALIHRDLKSPNLLVDREWRVKVADFNLSRIVDEGGAAGITSSANAGPTNPRWLAPEVLAGGPHTFASDVFSYAIVLWELLTWTTPWAGHDCVWQIAKAVLGGGRPEIPPPEQLPGGGFAGLPDYLDLLRRCWAQEPQGRPSFDEIISKLRKLLLVATRGSGPTTRGVASERAAEAAGQTPGSGEDAAV